MKLDKVEDVVKCSEIFLSSIIKMIILYSFLHIYILIIFNLNIYYTYIKKLTIKINLIKIQIYKFINKKIQIFDRMNLIVKNIYSFAKISFVGLGNMGFPMAINLANKGHTVFAYDVDHGK